MRFLLLSDIHGNLPAVSKLRAGETNRFDAVVVAGDIGSKRAEPIFTTLASFGCPVLYVYGNWDSALAYDAEFGPACHHLHLASYQCGPLSFAGFSGCPTNWGLNPIKASLDERLRAAHRPVLDALAAARDRRKREAKEVEAVYRAAAAAAQERPGARRRAKLDRLRRNRDRDLALLRLEMADLQGSAAFDAYRRDLRALSKQTLAMNRAALAKVIADSSTPARDTIVVTHERLSGTSRDFAGVPVFLFGHRHRFADTTFQGARFVNVAALDIRLLVQPKGRLSERSDRRNVNVGNYAAMTWTASGGFATECVRFTPSMDWSRDWEVVEGGDDPRAPDLP